MWTILSILFYLLLGFILLIGFVVLMLYVFAQVFKTTTPQEQLKEFGLNLMGYEFGDGYEVVESKSRNNHPDRPQDLRIKLNDDEFAKLKAHIDTLEDGEKKSTKKGTIYSDTITKYERGCSFEHTSTHSSCDYMFFSARAVVDYQKKEVVFRSTFY